VIRVVRDWGALEVRRTRDPAEAPEWRLVAAVRATSDVCPLVLPTAKAGADELAREAGAEMSNPATGMRPSSAMRSRLIQKIPFFELTATRCHFRDRLITEIDKVFPVPLTRR
jgi:hypothetical protein